MKEKSVLAIGSHPDDIEWGCAGTLLRLAKSGYRIYFYVATVGESGGDPEMRRTEQYYAVDAIRIEHIFWGGFKDRYIPDDHSVVKSIEDAIKQSNPTYILTHFPKDSHQDHRAIANATISAARDNCNILLYESSSSLEFIPLLYVNIQSQIDEKLRILEGFYSQADRNLKRSVLTIAQFRGLESGTRYAEAFNAVRLLLEV